MREVAILTRDEVPATMRRIVVAARKGARAARVRALVAQAARNVEGRSGFAPSARELFLESYSLALADYTYVPDPYGEEWVIAPGDVLADGIGDCSSATALVLALARACDLRGIAVLVSLPDGSGGFRAVHAFGAVELSPGSWAPADLASYLGVGDLRPFSAGAVFAGFEVDAESGGGIAGIPILDSLITGIFGLNAAEEQRAGLEAQADAAVAAAREQRVATERAARLQAGAVSDQADAVRDVATIQALVRAREIRGGEATVSRLVGLARELAPVAGAVLLAWALRPVLGNLTAPRRTGAARSAPRILPAKTAAKPRRAGRSLTRGGRRG